MADKKYIGTAKRINTQHGELIALGLPIDDLEKMIAARKAENQTWLNLTVGERRSPSDKGFTHNIWLDEFKPKSSQAASSATTQQASTNSSTGGDIDDDIPF